MAWKLKIYFSDNTYEIWDETFDSEESAQEKFAMLLDDWGDRQSSCSSAKQNHIKANVADCDIWEE